jgi:hypothetical protein
MVQVIKTENPKGKLAETLGMSLGQGIGNGLNTYFANRSLQSVLQDKALEGAPTSKKLEALISAASPYGEKGQELLNQYMQSAQQEMNEAEQDVLGRVAAGEKVPSKDLGRLRPETQLKVLQLQKNKETGRGIYNMLISAGLPEETAKLYQGIAENATTGGLSEIVKTAVDLTKRTDLGKGITGEKPEIQQTTKPTIEIPGANLGELQLDFPDLPGAVGMKPSDIVKQNEYREKTNIPLYTEAVDRLNSLDDEYREVKHLQDLNEIPGALPTGTEKWNVNWDTGDLRVKALATPEAQDYVKTIARMTRRANDFFPGRVTNFDLEQFKMGFPTLANSPEGRRVIAEQLALSNRIAYLKDETFKAAMDHYGSGSDPVLVKKYATENYRRLKSQLENQLKQVNTKARSMVEQEGSKGTRRSLDEIKQSLGK